MLFDLSTYLSFKAFVAIWFCSVLLIAAWLDWRANNNGDN